MRDIVTKIEVLWVVARSKGAVEMMFVEMSDLFKGQPNRYGWLQMRTSAVASAMR